jgi:hypothetical protein
MPIAPLRRRARNPQLERETPLVAIAAARQVVEEASLFLGEPLPSRYAAGLAFDARIAFARSPTFRRGFRHRSDGGRERLYVYLRHWLADRLHSERPELFRRLPASYCTGEALPAPAPGPLSNDARLLFGTL